MASGSSTNAAPRKRQILSTTNSLDRYSSIKSVTTAPPDLEATERYRRRMASIMNILIIADGQSNDFTNMEKSGLTKDKE